MKKPFILVLFACAYFAAPAQRVEAGPTAAIKWNPLGLLVGSVSIQGEYNFGGRHSVTAKLGLPVDANQDFTYDGKDAQFNMRATSFLAGFRSYLSKKKHMRGFYIEPFFQYLHHTSKGTGAATIGIDPVNFNFDNDYTGSGVGLQLGAQFMISNRVVIDLFFLGPQISSSEFHFKAVETTHTIPWNSVQAADAEKDIRDFFNQFPFLKNHTTITVDRNNRTVLADFSGAAPGIRSGISIGVAF